MENSLSNLEKDRLTDRQTDGQTDRQTGDRRIDGRTDGWMLEDTNACFQHSRVFFTSKSTDPKPEFKSKIYAEQVDKEFKRLMND